MSPAVRARDPLYFETVLAFAIVYVFMIWVPYTGTILKCVGAVGALVCVPLLFRAGAAYVLDGDTLSIRYALGLRSSIRLPLVTLHPPNRGRVWVRIRGGLPILLSLERRDHLALANALRAERAPELAPFEAPPEPPPLPPYDPTRDLFSVAALEATPATQCLVCGRTAHIRPMMFELKPKRLLFFRIARGVEVPLPVCRVHRWTRHAIRPLQPLVPIAVAVLAFSWLRPDNILVPVLLIHAAALGLGLGVGRRLFDAFVLRLLAREASGDGRAVGFWFVDPRVRARLAGIVGAESGAYR